MEWWVQVRVNTNNTFVTPKQAEQYSRRLNQSQYVQPRKQAEQYFFDRQGAKQVQNPT